MNLLACVFGFALCAAVAPLAGAAERFVKVRQSEHGGWCFEKDGMQFYSMGVCTMTPQERSTDGKGRAYDGVKVRGGLKKWAETAVSRITAAGFNTAGSWCDEAVYATGIASTRYLWLGAEVDGQKHRLLNVFQPGYAAAVDHLCQKFVAPHRNEPWLIGWYLDNELPWYGEFGWMNPSQKSLLELALALPRQDPAHRAATAFLQEHYGSFEKFRAHWDSAGARWEEVANARPKVRQAELATMAFAGKVAERFYSTVIPILRKHDPNHLILGSRFAGNAPGPVIAACARHCDVVSINRYQKDGHVDVAWWDRLYALTQKPILVTEFSFRAMENRSGARNRLGADVTVQTQAERASRYRKFVSGLMARPYLLGMHWFQWMDQPEHGRVLDGEDSNYGLVDWEDREYEELLAAAKATHAALPRAGTRSGPLPAAADRDGTQWSAPALAVLPTGTLSGPVELLGTERPIISVDKNGGSSGTAEQAGGAWTLALNTGTGWGLTYAWPAPTGKALAGAKAVRVKASGPAGLKLKVTFNELGLEQPSPLGDGESWSLPAQALGEGETTLVFDLKEAEVNQYYGNQNGNRRLDLDGLGYFGIAVIGAQGSGTVKVLSIALE